MWVMRLEALSNLAFKSRQYTYNNKLVSNKSVSFGKFTPQAMSAYERLDSFPGGGQQAAWKDRLRQFEGSDVGMPFNALVSVASGFSEEKPVVPADANEALIAAWVDRQTTKFMIAGRDQRTKLRQELSGVIKALTDTNYVFTDRSPVSASVNRAKDQMLIVTEAPSKAPPA
jgi:hypothetical protein